MMNGVEGGMSTGGWVLMSVVWVALVALVVWAVAVLFPRGVGSRGSEESLERPEEILERRFAVGEIDAATFEALRSTLHGARGVRVAAQRSRLLGAFVVLAVLAALVGGVTFAVARATDSPSGFGHMGESGYSMMGSSGKATAWYADGRGAVRNIAGARSQAQRFADRLGLKTAEVMQFSNNFYVQLDDTKGKPATEVLVDPQTGTVTLEYGPAMMWNTRYGMMGARSGGMMGGGSGGMMGGGSGGMMGGGSSGMMGGGSSGMMGGGSGGMMGGGSSGMMGSMGGVPDWTPARGGATGPVSASEARQIANRWLSGQRAGLVAAKPDALPGYFTMDTLKDGKPEGMLSVNERTGAVWYHWWHGRFVAMEG